MIEKHTRTFDKRGVVLIKNQCRSSLFLTVLLNLLFLPFLISSSHLSISCFSPFLLFIPPRPPAPTAAPTEGGDLKDAAFMCLQLATPSFAPSSHLLEDNIFKAGILANLLNSSFCE